MISVSGKRVSETLHLPNSEDMNAFQSKVKDHTQSAIKAILMHGNNKN